MGYGKILCFIIVGLLVTGTVSADIIVDFKARRPHQSWIEITVNSMPQGIVLLCLDASGAIISQTDGRTRMKIDRPGFLYAAMQSQLSKPFSFARDKDRLSILRAIKSEDIPGRIGQIPKPALWSCELRGATLEDYLLICPSK